MPTRPSEPLPIRLICLEPPPAQHAGEPAQFGLQDRAQQLHAGLPQADGALCFQVEIGVRTEGNTVAFAGPFVHGKRGDQFLYLSWRRSAGDWIKRLKIPLVGITPALLAQRSAGSCLVATVSGAGAARTTLLGEGWTIDAA
jgi:hypothetical protein